MNTALICRFCTVISFSPVQNKKEKEIVHLSLPSPTFHDPKFITEE